MKWLVLLALTTGVFGAQDFYPNYVELARHEREGVDYRITTEERGSAFTAMAIHAGDIEIVTGELARAIAGDDLNLYLFEAIKPRENKKLHITSDHFDEPRAVALARRSKTCVSVHGFLEHERLAVCVGGANGKLRDHLAEAFRQSKLGVEVEAPCQRFHGDSPANIVNRCQGPGVQLETSTALRRKMDDDLAFRASFARVVRQVLLEK